MTPPTPPPPPGQGAPPAGSLRLGVEPGPGLPPEERARLADLRGRIATLPYPALLGLSWDMPADVLLRRAAHLEEWLDALSTTPGLSEGDRESLSFCRAHLRELRWALGHPTLGPAYLAAARRRHEGSPSLPPSAEPPRQLPEALDP